MRYWRWLLSRATTAATSFPRAKLTFAGLASFGLASTAILLGPAVTILLATEGNPSSVNSWLVALSQSSPMILCGLYLKFSDRFFRTLGAQEEEKASWKYRMSLSSRVVQRWHEHCSTDDRIGLHQDLLECITVATGQILGTPYNSLAANLTVFVGPDLQEMRVAARSARVHNSSSRRLPTKEIAPGQALRQSTVYVVDDIRKAHEFAGVKQRWYRSVCCIPVCDAALGRAYGVVSIESDRPYTFFHRSADIAVNVQPYITAIRLTFDGRDPYYTACWYDVENL
jgi:hypothetical protein